MINQEMFDSQFSASRVKRMERFHQRVASFVGAGVVVGERSVIVGFDRPNGKRFENCYRYTDGWITMMMLAILIMRANL